MSTAGRLSVGFLIGFLWASSAHAGKAEDLGRILLEDPSYKVRVQAALLLGKLGDPSGVPPLLKALGDENRSVRAVVAQSLGRLRSPDAIAGLNQALDREGEAFVRTQIENALVALGAGNRNARIYLAFGAFTGGAKRAGTADLAILRAALKRELGKLPSVTFSLGAGEEKNFGKSGRLGFLIDGNVARLDDGMVGDTVEINCDVKVMVARWPSKSIILWTSAGAAVQGGMRDRDKENARRDCLEASAGQLGEDLSKFFASQGG